MKVLSLTKDSVYDCMTLNFSSSVCVFWYLLQIKVAVTVASVSATKITQEMHVNALKKQICVRGEMGCCVVAMETVSVTGVSVSLISWERIASRFLLHAKCSSEYIFVYFI